MDVVTDGQSISAYGMARSTVQGSPLEPAELQHMHAYWRASLYLSVGMIYLRDNPLLREPLKPAHVKRRLLGHWGSDPGMSLTYIHLNRLIRKYDLDAIFIAGPGHGAPALISNTYLEGTYSEIYSDISEDTQVLQLSFLIGLPICALFDDFQDDIALPWHFKIRVRDPIFQACNREPPLPCRAISTLTSTTGLNPSSTRLAAARGARWRRCMCADCWAPAGARAFSRWPSGSACPGTTRCTISSAAGPGMTRRCGACWPNRSRGRLVAREPCWWSMTRVFPRKAISRSGWRGSTAASWARWRTVRCWSR